MSWQSWFCPKPTEDDEPADYRKIREEQMEKEQLASQGFVPYCGQYWNLNKIKFNEEKWDQKLKDAKRASVRYFDLSGCTGPKILYQIMHIQFLELRSLYLKENKITSTEPLVSLHAPTLVHLDLRQNFIVSIKPLRKLPNRFEFLIIAENPILDYSPITEVTFSKKCPKYVTTLSGVSSGVVHSINPLLKAESKYIRTNLQLLNIRNNLQSSAKRELLDKK